MFVFFSSSTFAFLALRIRQLSLVIVGCDGQAYAVIAMNQSFLMMPCTAIMTYGLGKLAHSV